MYTQKRSAHAASRLAQEAHTILVSLHRLRRPLLCRPEYALAVKARDQHVQELEAAFAADESIQLCGDGAELDELLEGLSELNEELPPHTFCR